MNLPLIVSVHHWRSHTSDTTLLTKGSYVRNPAISPGEHYAGKSLSSHSFGIRLLRSCFQNSLLRDSFGSDRKEIRMDQSIRAVCAGCTRRFQTVRKNPLDARVLHTLPQKRIVPDQHVGIDTYHPLVTIEPVLTERLGQRQHGSFLVSRIIHDLHGVCRVGKGSI